MKSISPKPYQIHFDDAILFHELIPMRTDPARFGADPAESFTVVAPSLSGYTFPSEPNQPRFSVEQMSEVFSQLRTDILGYKRFAAQGGDWSEL